MSENHLLPGTLIADKYRIDSAIGSGGFGTVYRGTHLAMGRPVAIKIFRPTPNEQLEPEKLARRTERFNREAQFASKLEHSNTIRVYDFGQDKQMLYIVMEYLEGKTLRELLVRKGQLPVEEAVQIASQILASLEEAHHKGILHRDLKPPNIVMTRDFRGQDVVKVLDFGIAKQVIDGHFGAEGRELTGNVFVGTPNYCAPEQLFKRPLSPATDLFCVGLLLWEMLFGDPLLSPEGVGHVILQMRSTEPWRIPDEPKIPRALETVLLKALEKEPALRFQSAESMRKAVQEAMSRASTGTPQGPPPLPRNATQLGMPGLASQGAQLMDPNLDGDELDLDAMFEASARPARGSSRPVHSPGPTPLAASPAPAASSAPTVSRRVPAPQPEPELDLDWQRAARPQPRRMHDAPEAMASRPGRLAPSQSPNPLASLGRHKKPLFIGVGVVIASTFLLFGPIDWQKTRNNPGQEADRLLGQLDTIAVVPRIDPGLETSRFSEQGIVVAAQSIGWRVLDRADTSDVGTMTYRMIALHHTKANITVDMTVYQARTHEAVQDLVTNARYPDQVIRFDSLLVRLSPRDGQPHPEIGRLHSFLERYRESVLTVADERDDKR
jgi:eukaryotic-like serine/threonine-protein kinase